MQGPFAKLAFRRPSGSRGGIWVMGDRNKGCVHAGPLLKWHSGARACRCAGRDPPE